MKIVALPWLVALCLCLAFAAGLRAGGRADGGTDAR